MFLTLLICGCDRIADFKWYFFMLENRKGSTSSDGRANNEKNVFLSNSCLILKMIPTNFHIQHVF